MLLAAVLQLPKRTFQQRSLGTLMTRTMKRLHNCLARIRGYDEIQDNADERDWELGRLGYKI